MCLSVLYFVWDTASLKHKMTLYARNFGGSHVSLATTMQLLQCENCCTCTSNNSIIAKEQHCWFHSKIKVSGSPARESCSSAKCKALQSLEPTVPRNQLILQTESKLLLHLTTKHVLKFPRGQLPGCLPWLRAWFSTLGVLPSAGNLILRGLMRPTDEV